MPCLLRNIREGHLAGTIFSPADASFHYYKALRRSIFYSDSYTAGSHSVRFVSLLKPVVGAWYWLLSPTVGRGLPTSICTKWEEPS